MPVTIFFCYAHEDEALLNQLKAHLRPLQREGLIDVWHDRDISAGTEWEQEISKHLNTAQIILLLVSPDFIDSDYCYGIEMKRAMERHKKGEAYVIPVVLRPVYWQGSPFGKLQALPTDAKPVIDRYWHSVDEALYDVAEGIRKVVKMLQKEEEEERAWKAEIEQTRKARERCLERGEREWRVLRMSIRGAAHVKADLPNQDAISWKQISETGIPLVLTIADGHGNEKNFRSEIGARLAVESAEEVMSHFAIESSNYSFRVINDEIKNLPLHIVSRWRELVEEHLNKNPISKYEWKWLMKKQADTWKAVQANPSIPYETTLLTVLVTNLFILYLQLGDGDILTVSANGEVSEPMPIDKLNAATEITSFINPNAEQYFRIHFQRFSNSKPALILLSSDGYSNSFREREEFLKVSSDIWNIICTDGLQKIEENLYSWLTKGANFGSNGDITLGLLCRIRENLNGIW